MTKSKLSLTAQVVGVERKSTTKGAIFYITKVTNKKSFDVQDAELKFKTQGKDFEIGDEMEIEIKVKKGQQLTIDESLPKDIMKETGLDAFDDDAFEGD